MASITVTNPRPGRLPLEVWHMIMEFVCLDAMTAQVEDSFIVAARILSLRTTCIFINAALLPVLRLRLDFYAVDHLARYLRTLLRHRNEPVNVGKMCDTLCLRDDDLWGLDFLNPSLGIRINEGLAQLCRLRRLEVQWSINDHNVLSRLASFSRLEELILLPDLIILDDVEDDNSIHVYQHERSWSHALAQLASLRRLEMLSTDFFHALPANVYYKERRDREVELLQSWTTKSALLNCIVLAYRVGIHPPLTPQAFWRVGRFERTVLKGWECKGAQQYRSVWYNNVNSYMSLPRAMSLFW